MPTNCGAMRAEKFVGVTPLKLKLGERRPLLSFQLLMLTPPSVHR